MYGTHFYSGPIGMFCSIIYLFIQQGSFLHQFFKYGLNIAANKSFYRTPHDSQGTQIEELDLSLSKLGNKINTHNVIITGDFNLPKKNWENHHVTPNCGYSTVAANKLLSLVEEHGLIQHVNEPTRKQRNANNILDLVFTNRPGLIKKLNVVDGISDHSTVIIDVNISPKRKHHPKRTIIIRNKADHPNIQKSLDDFTHEYFSLNQNMTANDKWNLVSTKIINIMNQYVPCRLTTSRFNLPWFSKDLKKMCKKRNDYIRKQKDPEIQKTGKSSVTSGKTCTNTFVLLDCPT